MVALKMNMMNHVGHTQTDVSISVKPSTVIYEIAMNRLDMQQLD